MLGIVDIFYYIIIYFFLFYSIFYLLTFYTNRRTFFNDPKPRKKPPISIIIPAYNEEKHIEKAIKSILSQNYPKDKLKVLVVDDGSIDKTVEIAKQFHQVKVIKKKHGGFKAATLNVGLKQIATELVGFMDADSYLTKNSISYMVGYLEDKTVGAVMGTVRVAKPKNLLQRVQHIEYMIFMITKRVFHFIDGNYVTPAFAVYRTSELKSLGGFEENNPAEDIEIALRYLNKGYKVKNSYKGIVYTETPDTIKGLAKQRIRWSRGFFANTRKYSHMIFNSKQGDLGMFSLPIAYVNIILVNIFIGLILAGIYTGVVTNIVYYNAIGFDFSDIFRKSFDFNFIYDYKTIFMIASALLTVVVICIARARMKGKRITKVRDYAFFLLAYPIITNALLIIALFQHLRRAKRGW
ncbi:MAG TPA: glycosyltransferase [archaeon]|nr:glycosyltransferase [archaeon]